MRLPSSTKCIILGLSFLTFTSLANGAEVDGINFADEYVAEDKTMRLTGAGLLRYWGFKAYTGALYLEEGASVDEVFLDTAKRIELEYTRAIKGKDFGPAIDKSHAMNVDTATYDLLRPRIEYHNFFFEDVRPGDRYSLTYIPGRGTELALNGEPKGVIEGADFAVAVFSIWLGPEPINTSFKKQILGL